MDKFADRCCWRDWQFYWYCFIRYFLNYACPLGLDRLDGKTLSGLLADAVDVVQKRVNLAEQKGFINPRGDRVFAHPFPALKSLSPFDPMSDGILVD